MPLQTAEELNSMKFCAEKAQVTNGIPNYAKEVNLMERNYKT